jgi:hypothetical protein
MNEGDITGDKVSLNRTVLSRIGMRWYPQKKKSVEHPNDGADDIRRRRAPVGDEKKHIRSMPPSAKLALIRNPRACSDALRDAVRRFFLFIQDDERRGI